MGGKRDEHLTESVAWSRAFRLVRHIVVIMSFVPKAGMNASLPDLLVC
jgi:hypothetical protein